MNKLQLLRTIGESYARTVAYDIISDDEDASRFFEILTEEMYPVNLHRRHWALTNLELFYSNERARITVFQKLKGQTPTNFDRNLSRTHVITHRVPKCHK
jgi:hypothetical protein